ncbi:reverse transcriptase family protein [Parvularcula maris]|uniref:RNA-directed DNA polymerase n=1 Tax=Parvularcula maris TaxID=2965077 RepID=A0A9X2L6P9_9PROT|nr:reverse transcriptase domain-containing protein [Parvularcula maris]MCQ8184056.1 reverse transcriptase domain-containing protein [Parvularcula maris]
MQQFSPRQDIVLWAVGIVQPARAEDVIAFIRLFFEDSSIRISRIRLSDWLAQQADQGLVQYETVGKVRYFSLAPNSRFVLPKDLRYRRDAMRLFLLKDASTDKVVVPYGEAHNEMDGVSPSSPSRSGLQRSGTNKTPAVFRHRPSYWSRLPRQIFESGRSAAPYGPKFRYYAVENDRRETARESLNRIHSFASLANLLGISPLLLSRMAFYPDRYYRSFKLRKKSGGEREIYAPRVFLKTVQRFLNDYFFGALPTHPSVHGFMAGRSIQSNSSCHVRQNFVGSIDIKNFFPSVTAHTISNKLTALELAPGVIEVIKGLCTLHNSLPQGAPTSPSLANFCLRDADTLIANTVSRQGVVYTRYADDLTFSGSSRAAIEASMETARTCLEAEGFSLNPRKSRINSRGGHQRVTGCVVNQHVAPPRKERRQLRARMHNLQRSESVSQKTFYEVSGKVAYYGSFSMFAKTKEYEDLKAYLEALRAKL